MGVGVMVKPMPIRVTPPPKKMVGVKDRQYIYFDNAATGKLSEYAKELIRECLDEDWCWANGSSIYKIGREAKEKLEESRSIVASCINAKPSEIIFTSGASEGISQIINGVITEITNKAYKSKSILSSPYEHPSVYATFKALKQYGVYYLSVDEWGHISKLDFERSLWECGGIGLCCLMMVQNELGIAHPIKEFTELSHSKSIPFFSDMTQAVGKIIIDVKDLGVDYMCASGHKWGALRQSGFVYISEKAKIKPTPLIRGSQERGQRAGTESVLNAWVMAKTLQAKIKILKEDMESVERLKHRFVHELNSLQEDIGMSIELNGNPLAESNYGIGIVNFCIPDMKMTGESIQLMMGAELSRFEIPIYVSTASACSSGSNSPSRVLMALPGMDAEKANRSVRVSFSTDNQLWEIEYFISKLKYVLENLH